MDHLELSFFLPQTGCSPVEDFLSFSFVLTSSLPSFQSLLFPPSSRKSSLTTASLFPANFFASLPVRGWPPSPELYLLSSIACLSIRTTPAHIKPGPMGMFVQLGKDAPSPPHPCVRAQKGVGGSVRRRPAARIAADRPVKSLTYDLRGRA